MSDVTLLLEGVPLTVAPDGTISGEHDIVHTANVKVQRTIYSPNRQQTAVSILQRMGAVLEHSGGVELFARPGDYDPLVWY